MCIAQNRQENKAKADQWSKNIISASQARKRRTRTRYIALIFYQSGLTSTMSNLVLRWLLFGRGGGVAYSKAGLNVAFNSYPDHPPPGTPPGICTENIPGPRAFDSQSFPGPRAFDKPRDIQNVYSIYCIEHETCITVVSAFRFRYFWENTSEFEHGRSPHFWFPISASKHGLRKLT